MEEILNRLSVRLTHKGFISVEIKYIIQDIIYIIPRGQKHTIAAINQEFEWLGWGIGIIDNKTYELIMLLLENLMGYDLRQYI